MAPIGIEEGFKRFLIPAMLLLFLSGCGNQPQSKKTTSVDKRTHTTNYITTYNEKKQVESVAIQKIMEDPYGTVTEYMEKIYFYDDLDSLIRKEVFSVEEDKRILKSLDLYSPQKEEKIHFNTYPDDTLSYVCRIKDKRGNIVWEHYKENIPYISQESVYERIYDKQGRLKTTVIKSIDYGETDTLHYIYKHVNDTLIESTLQNGSLITQRKAYSDENVKVEVTTSFDIFSTDTIFTEKGRIYSVYYSDGYKSIEEAELDEQGNYIRVKEEVWMEYEEDSSPIEDLLGKIKQLN